MRYKDDDIQKFNDALRRALNQKPGANDLAAIIAFEGAGLKNVQPRVNVLTFNAWKACGRSVLAGQHSVRVGVITNKPYQTKNDLGEETGEVCFRRVPGTAYLFHISQTQPDPNWDEDSAIPEARIVRGLNNL
jgi:hypothetical protein